MRLVWVLAATVAAMGSAPLLAQTNADKTRKTRRSAPASPPAKASDNTASIRSQRPLVRCSLRRTLCLIPMNQSKLRRSVTAEQLLKLGKEQQRSAAAPLALSSRMDGRPGGLVTLEGNDPRDPQLPGAKELASCRRVIEPRAEEFGRTPASLVSPEAALLFSDRTSGSLATNGQSDRNVRTAIQVADPENPTNQELAAVISAAPPRTPDAQLPIDGQDKALGQLIGEPVVQIQSGRP